MKLRVIEQFELGDLQDHLVPTPLPPSTQSGSSGPDLEHFLGWGFHSVSGQPVPVPRHAWSEEFPTCVW